MAYDATEILGAPQVAGARVLSKGYIKRQAAGPAGVGLVGGVTGAVISATASEAVGRQQKNEQAEADTPHVGRSAFLAATADELALIGINEKSLTGKLGDVLARVPRGDVRSIEYDGGFISKLTVFLTDETKWEFDVAKGGGKAAKGIAALFTG